MSQWTHVSGVITADTMGNSDAESMYIAQTVVNHLPLITGSERDATFYVNLQRGPTRSSDTDEFDQWSNLSNYGMYSNLSKRYTNKRWFESQPNVIITLDGDLRDKTFNETLRETTRTLTRLAERLIVLKCFVCVSDYFGRSYVFNNPEWIKRIDLSDWTRKFIFERYNYNNESRID